MKPIADVYQATQQDVKTQRMTIRAILASDLIELAAFHAASMDSFRPWVPSFPADATPTEMASQQLKTATQSEQSGSDLKRIGVLDDGQIVGCFNLNIISRGVFQNAFAGWSIRPDMQRQGYGAEGVRGLLRLAFTVHPHGADLHRVQANIMPENRASIALAERCGFRLEGRLIRYLKIDGEWRDHLAYAILCDELRL